MSKEADEYEKNVPQHVRAAKMLAERGYPIGANTNISFIKTFRYEKDGKNMKKIDDIKPVELAKKEEVNVEKYLKYLKSTFEQILDPMEVNFDEEVLGIAILDSWIQK